MDALQKADNPLRCEICGEPTQSPMVRCTAHLQRGDPWVDGVHVLDQAMNRSRLADEGNAKVAKARTLLLEASNLAEEIEDRYAEGILDAANELLNIVEVGFLPSHRGRTMNVELPENFRGLYPREADELRRALADSDAQRAALEQEIAGLRGEASKYQQWYEALTQTRMTEPERQLTALREALTPFLPGAGEWGRYLAWIVNGAPTRDEGVEAARQIVEWRAALADVQPETGEQK